MRVAFTIIYNGLHHLQHNGFAEFMAANFDLWVVVEGHARPGGSTSWCKFIPVDPVSNDGTIDYMEQFCRNHKNVKFYSHGRFWHSKDMQVNHALDMIRARTSNAMLWQVDCDEVWSIKDIEKAEHIALSRYENAFSFQHHQYVGENLIASGGWGDSSVTRLWKWKGEFFTSHEPAAIQGQKDYFIPGLKFHHYSYYFERDVIFKSQYYRGHEKVYENWLRLQSKTETDFPLNITSLFGHKTQYKSTISWQKNPVSLAMAVK